MKLDALLSRARYLAIALPLFALASTIHAGCTSNPNFYYGNGGGVYHTAGESNEPSACIVYRSGESGTGGYFGPCDDDGYAYGGYGGYGP